MLVIVLNLRSCIKLSKHAVSHKIKPELQKQTLCRTTFHAHVDFILRITKCSVIQWKTKKALINLRAITTKSEYFLNSTVFFLKYNSGILKCLCEGQQTIVVSETGKNGSSLGSLMFLCI